MLGEMTAVVDVLLCLAVSVSLLAFAVFYSKKAYRCNSEFGGQMHCVSGIILCHKPLFGFLMHSVGGTILLAAGLRASTTSSSEASLLALSLMYVSLSGVVNFDVRDFKPIHFTSLAGVLVFSVAFVWMQCDYATAMVYVFFSVFFVAIILFNLAFARWEWPWMDVQASVEIVWVLCLLACMISYCVPSLLRAR
jgi:hypothetical protein